jgi:hypothetical protein
MLRSIGEWNEAELANNALITLRARTRYQREREHSSHGDRRERAY